MKPIRSRAYSFRSTAFLCAALLCLLLPQKARAEVYAFFQGTQYPLEVHVLHGREPGPTVMVQGGIQGDEVSGFLSAQTLTRAKVSRGTLIVIPRANVPSISRRCRVVNVDLNRRFDREYDEFFEDRLARVIRHFLARSQAFIHLHEGSGFYSPTYVNGLRNPQRWGQSVIIDAGVFENSLDLSGMVRSVLSRLNPQVRPADYRFELFNTDTFSPTSPYGGEMRKSLTCYALKEHRIPALAIEVSKSIKTLDWKVREQLRATILFLEKFGVHAQLPDLGGISFDRYASKPPAVHVNGQAFRPGGTIEVQAGQPLRVEVDTASGDRRFEAVPALYADGRFATDLAKTPRLPLDPIGKLELRADGKSIGTAKVRVLGSWPGASGDQPLFVVWHNGRLKRLAPGQTLHAVEGDQMLIEGVRGSRGEIVNIKGIITRPGENTGQDAGIDVVLDYDNFMERFLVKDGDGHPRVQVVRETPGRKGAEFLVALEPRRIEAVKLAGPQGQTVMLPANGSVHRLQPGQWRIDGIWSNGEQDRLVPLLAGMPLRVGQNFTLDAGAPLELEFRQSTTFKPVGGLTLAPAALADNSPRP